MAVSGSISFSHFATTIVATELPIRLVMTRASLMKRSMPRISASAATGIVPTMGRTAASVMNPLPVTPFEVIFVASQVIRFLKIDRKPHIIVVIPVRMTGRGDVRLVTERCTGVIKILANTRDSCTDRGRGLSYPQKQISADRLHSGLLHYRTR